MTDETPIIVMRPVDVSVLPQDPDLMRMLPKPSIEHSIKPCDRCGRDCWIGPAQLFRKTMNGGEALCYLCALPVVTLAQDVAYRTLDKTADQKPRRT